MTPVLVIACAWCPDFDPKSPSNKGVSHGMCATCAKKLNAELDALDVSA